MSARKKDNERQRENDGPTAGFEKKWLKICKPTSARSVTRGGWKPEGMGDNVSSARAHLVSPPPSSSLDASVVRMFFMFHDQEEGFPRDRTSILSSRNGTDICLMFRG